MASEQSDQSLPRPIYSYPSASMVRPNFVEPLSHTSTVVNKLSDRYLSKDNSIKIKVEYKSANNHIIPFPLFVRNGKKAIERMLESHDIMEDCCITALCATIYTFDRLWSLALSDPRFRHYLEKVRIGLHDEDHGDILIFAGVAAEYFEKKETEYFEKKGIDKKSIVESPQYVGFLNCGNDGIKWQFYRKLNGTIRLVTEFKPKHKVVNTFADDWTAYSVKDILLDDVLIAANKLVVEHEACGHHMVMHDIPLDTKIFAFVTGTIRDQWENTMHQNHTFDGFIENLFAFIPVKPFDQNTFFMSRNQQHLFESKGTAVLYDNLAKDGLIDKGSVGHQLVDVSFRIARDSCQMIIGQKISIPYNFGTTNQVELLNIPDAIIRGLGVVVDGKSTLEHLLISIDKKPFSIWALGSECVALLRDKQFKDIYEMIIDPRDLYFKDEVIKQAFKGIEMIEEAIHLLDQETINKVVKPSIALHLLGSSYILDHRSPLSIKPMLMLPSQIKQPPSQ